MGTRADFYIGRGENAEWLGSIAWDGYPDGIAAAVLDATTADDYRTRLAVFFEGRDDVTLPDDGWPWPWDNSGTTDFAYALDGGEVWASCFGHPWQIASEWDGDCEDEDGTPVEHPDMAARKNVQFGGKRSGLITFSVPADESRP